MEKFRYSSQDIPSGERNKNPDQNFTLLPPLEYLDTLHNFIPKAKQRVWLQTMNFEADHTFGAVSQLLKNAAQAGIDTRLHVDYFYKMVTDGKIDLIPSVFQREQQYRRFRREAKQTILNQLTDAEVGLTVTNTPHDIFEKIMPGRGRNHIKLAILDNKAFFGGINLSDKDFKRPDFMLEITDSTLVEPLADVFLSGEGNKPVHDYAVEVHSQTSLLVDAGKPGSSIILTRAIDMIDSSRESITLSSQFTPDGAIVDALQSAKKRGVAVDTIVSDPNKITERSAWLFDRINQLSFWQKGYTIPLLEYPDWLHVKILLVDKNLPERQTIVGTHNFSGKGVMWGNQEIAIQSKDERLLETMTNYVNRLASLSSLRK